MAEGTRGDKKCVAQHHTAPAGTKSTSKDKKKSNYTKQSEGRLQHVNIICRHIPSPRMSTTTSTPTSGRCCPWCATSPPASRCASCAPHAPVAWVWTPHLAEGSRAIPGWSTSAGAQGWGQGVYGWMSAGAGAGNAW
eukprot:364466-Chlamydomonas_euryale.AAC.16